MNECPSNLVLPAVNECSRFAKELGSTFDDPKPQFQIPHLFLVCFPSHFPFGPQDGKRARPGVDDRSIADITKDYKEPGSGSSGIQLVSFPLFSLLITIAIVCV
ncbi:hypothetical protein BD289DRAFT_236630 [Coniella lustricola]|uniref:Uncharacterized protein n=1 Tax=Coniella lustricola TaxID=2025994 RepID=A0A2T3A9R1_9PEZI|nr:hypothetical protein BD289DRAFT_236630 [Coniella lustricola]